ncbi:MAG: SDR family oxidoreductase [Bacteroidales bacterium]
MAKILITGANGYIGKRIISVLLEHGHDLVCCVRDKSRFFLPPSIISKLKIIEVDLLNLEDYNSFPEDIEYAYFLVHSMSNGISDFYDLEKKLADNFILWAERIGLKQVVYLSGLKNDFISSLHLDSRHNVEQIFIDSKVPYTILRAGIVVGSGSASFEIIRDLVEKLPIMVAPKWIDTQTQPIGIRNVIQYLSNVLGVKGALNQIYDIGGKEVMTYKEMLFQYAEIRNLKRKIISLPVLTPRLSSYWLYFVTSTNYALAVNLVNSMTVPVVCRDQRIREITAPELLTYKESIKLAFSRVEQNIVTSSWKDSFNMNVSHHFVNDHLQIPTEGCFKNYQEVSLKSKEVPMVINKVWQIGGQKGWFYADFLWRVRGIIDKFLGGIGLRRGRTNKKDIFPGDALDFWRVILADKKEGRLLLYAEMKLPGEAWLEFSIKKRGDKFYFTQTATYRPLGVFGRFYWYVLTPFHFFIFKGMIQNIVDEVRKEKKPPSSRRFLKT